MTEMPSSSGTGTRRARWTLLTNHARTLLCIADDPGVRLRDIAQRLDITERAAQVFVNDLVDAGYVTRTRTGRRNTYEVHPDMPFRHPREHDHEIGALLAALGCLPCRGRQAGGEETPKTEEVHDEGVSANGLAAAARAA